MTTYEQQIIHGVPFLVSNGSVFYYDPLALPWSADPKEPIRIGTFTNSDLRLDAGWEERVKSRVDAWRATISPVGRNEVVRAPKQSKPKRSPKSAAKTAGTTGETATTAGGTTAAVNIIINPTVVAATAAPEPTPKRVLKRRKVVQSNAS